MKKTKKTISLILAIIVVSTVFMTNVFADNEHTHDGEFYSNDCSPFNSIAGWYDFDDNMFVAQTLATCSSGHTAMVETWIIWEDPVSLDSHVVYEHTHGYVGTNAQSTVYSQVDNIPTNFESGHFYYYDGVMRIEAYLPGPTIYCGN